MTSHDPQTALVQVIGVLAAVVFGCLLLAAITKCKDWVQGRRESRARLAAMPALSPEALDAGCKRLLAVIPAQRTGGGRR